MKKLPSLYKNPNIKTKDNNKKLDYIKIDKQQEIEKTISSLFNTLGYVFNIPLEIKTINKVYNTYLVSQTEKTITTIDNEIINKQDIIDIKCT